MPEERGEPYARQIQEIVETARRSWPGIRVTAAAFGAHVRAITLDARTLDIRGLDLFLAFACASGDAGALRVFEGTLLPNALTYVMRFNPPSDLRDELRQTLRVRLLVGSPPRIAGYRGEGPLEAWVRVAAVHLTMNQLATAKALPRLLESGEAEALAALGGDPELEAARARLSQPLSQALSSALEALPPREKTLLRLSVVDGLSIDEIATIYQVHRATAARWLVGIRSTVLKAVRARLGLPVQPTSSEFRSIVGLLRDELHVSVERALRG